MKITEKWLREYVNPHLNLAELADKLTMAGLEVENISPVAGQVSKIVVARVLDVQPHPDADKLRVCQVDVGSSVLQIVCGAKNVASGMKVPAALVGADLGNDFVIKAAKLRGVESFGMLCSASELGLAENSEGLLSLPDDAPIGQEIRDYLQLDDHTIEISLTPNRGDCLSVAGIARELSALTHTPLTLPVIKPVSAEIADTLALAIHEPAMCPFYSGRVIKGINPTATTPFWMVEKLRRCGLRSIHPVVDVTNYVMLELGQPMHAFDLAQLQGGIQVRRAKSDESLTLLDGKTVSLNTNSFVIADDKQALALAGIIGGVASAVNASTQSIFLESAFFAPSFIAGEARAYRLHTDSAHRFERGVDPLLPEKALERATTLLLDIVGGQAGPVITAGNKSPFAEKQPIELRLARVQEVLGISLNADWVESNLPYLGFTLTSLQEGKSWQVKVPSYRFDIAIEADLIEEAARLYGYDAIPYAVPNVALTAHPQSEFQLNLRQIKQTLVARDYAEAITYSFVDPMIQELFDPAISPYRLANPISPELSVMRTSIWQGLIETYRQNAARQAPRIRLFESGLCFLPHECKLEQSPFLAGLCAGSVYPLQWGLPKRPVDFYDVKKDVEALLALRQNNLPADFVPIDLYSQRESSIAKSILSLHPGRSAAILVGGQKLGYIGELHPRIAAALDIREPVYLFELSLNEFIEARLPQFAPLSKYPAVRRDLAIILKRDISIDAVKQVCQDICGSLLVNWQLFDVYEGKNIDPSYRSLAFGFTLQHFERTLTETDVADCMTRLVSELYSQLGAVLRE